ncbi:MAG: endolytic transglycosylase MltG [Oscillospiraceae bacterium]|nr:endolytic transglycosylase MltG [Oscillospiraceae bacterium]
MSDKNNYDNIDELLSSILNDSRSAQAESESMQQATVPEDVKTASAEASKTSVISTAIRLDDEIDESEVSGQTNVFNFGTFQTQSGHTVEASDGEPDSFASESVPEEQATHNKKKKKRRKKNYTAYGGIVLATLVLCTSTLISLFIIVVIRDVLGIEDNDNEFTIYIEEGSSTWDIAGQLYDEGIIQYKEVFVAFARIMGADGNMYPGDLDVAYNMSYSDIINDLMEARESKETVTITFIEGISLYEAAQLLENNSVCDADEFIYTFNSTTFGYDYEQYVSSESLKLYKYEGFLFPDTYEFYVGDTAYNVAKKIRERTNEILTSDVIARAEEIGMSLEDVVILASIVQKEAGNTEDMPAVASVFINRLNNPEQYPRLQTDATTAYIDNIITQVMTVSSQSICDAYDTYTCLGLPVGAICNPGADAINAVLYADETDYYYFCTDPETGVAYFASTYDEHIANCELLGIM